MQSLEDYEKERAAFHASPPKFKGSGVSCPECGNELHDEGESLISKVPPMKRLYCPTCDFSKVVLA